MNDKRHEADLFHRSSPAPGRSHLRPAPTDAGRPKRQCSLFGRSGPHLNRSRSRAARLPLGGPRKPRRRAQKRSGPVLDALERLLRTLRHRHEPASIAVAKDSGDALVASRLSRSMLAHLDRPPRTGALYRAFHAGHGGKPLRKRRIPSAGILFHRVEKMGNLDGWVRRSRAGEAMHGQRPTRPLGRGQPGGGGRSARSAGAARGPPAPTARSPG